MTFPIGINNVFFNNDKDNQLNTSIFRTAYLTSIIKLFKIISYIACAFNIGILLTILIKKCKIIFLHYHLYKFLPIIGGINANLFGLFMQPIV